MNPVGDKYKFEFAISPFKTANLFVFKNKKSTKKYYYFIVTNRNSTEALSL